MKTTLILAVVLSCCPLLAQQQKLPPNQFPAGTFDHGLDGWDLSALPSAFSNEVMRADGRTPSPTLTFTSPGNTGTVSFRSKVKVPNHTQRGVAHAYFLVHLAARLDNTRNRVSVTFRGAESNQWFGEGEFGFVNGGGWVERYLMYHVVGHVKSEAIRVDIFDPNSRSSQNPIAKGDKIWIDNIEFRGNMSIANIATWPWRCSIGGTPVFDPKYSAKFRHTHVHANYLRQTMPFALLMSPDYRGPGLSVPGIRGKYLLDLKATILIHVGPAPGKNRNQWSGAGFNFKIPFGLGGTAWLFQAVQFDPKDPADSHFGIPKRLVINDGRL